MVALVEKRGVGLLGAGGREDRRMGGGLDAA